MLCAHKETLRNDPMKKSVIQSDIRIIVKSIVSVECSKDF